jgi:hypothetical protein
VDITHLVANFSLCDKELMQHDIASGTPLAPAKVSEARIRICGVAVWDCQYCGHPHRSRMQYFTEGLQCSNRDCRRVMVPVQRADPSVIYHAETIAMHRAALSGENVVVRTPGASAGSIPIRLRK